MTTKAQLVEAVQRNVDDDEVYDSGTVLNILNEGLLEIAGGVLMPDGRTTPPLPDLVDSDTVVTVTDAAFTDLPDDYHRGLFFVSSAANGGSVAIKPLSWILEKYPELDESGSVSVVGIKGTSRIYYQSIPSTPDTLTLHFYRKPSLMVDDGDEPEGIPAHLAKKLLVNFALKEIFDEIEQDESGKKSNTTRYTNKFNEAVYELYLFIGEEDTGPIYIEDVSDYCMDDI